MNLVGIFLKTKKTNTARFNNSVTENAKIEHYCFKSLKSSSLTNYSLITGQHSTIFSINHQYFLTHHFYTPPHFSGEVLCYTLRCLSVRPCSPFPIDNLSIYSRNFFKFCIHIVIGDEWYGIVNGQNPSIFNGVTALFRIGKMVSGLLFLYCS